LVIPWVTLKMALLPKRLVWVKTLHLGGDQSDLATDAGGSAEDPDGQTELVSEAG
jgi:1,2-diacylglycerol 3-beta-glucosyltransferase